MFKVARRGLVAHSIRLLLTAIAVVASVSFMCGTQVLTATISTSFDKVFADVYENIDAVVRSSVTVNTGFGPQRALVDEEALAPVGGVQGVRAVEGQVQGLIAILDKAGEPMGSANAGPPTFGLNWLHEPALNGWHLSSGRAPEAPGEVVLDRKSAERAGYRVDDVARIQTNKGAQDFTVVGIAGFGATPNYAGSAAALFETATAQQLLGEPGKFNWIEVAGDDGVTQDELRKRITFALPPDTQAITGKAFTAESQDAFRRFFDIIGTFLLVMGGVAMFVGTFIIYNTFSIIVAQRTRELALLRAMGASRFQVLLSVVGEALMAGAISALVGLGGGLLLASLLTSLLSASGFGPPIEALSTPPFAFVSSFLIGTIVTLVAGLVPAWKASRVPPVAAMRDVAIDTAGRSRGRLVVGGGLTAQGALLLYLGLFTTASGALVKVGAGIFSVLLGVAALGPLFATPLSATLGAPLRKITGRLARSNAMRNPKRTATTASALMIGVGLVVMSSIVIESVKAAFTQVIESSFTGDFVVASGSFDPRSGFDPSLATELGNVTGVQEAVGFRLGFAQLGNDGAVVVGVDLVALSKVFQVDQIQGSLTDVTGDTIAVEADRASEKGWTIGTSLSLRLLTGEVKQFRIACLYEIPANPRSGLLMPLPAFESSFPPNLQLDNTIYVKVADGADTAAVKRDLTTIVKREFPTGAVQDLTEFTASQTGFLDVFLLIITALLLLAIIIAFIGIINTLLLSVYERTHEIGLLRAVGMARRQVRSTVRWESVIISLQGTLLGTAVGFVFSWALVRAISDDQPLAYTVPVGQLVTLVVLAAIAGVIAALYPAWRASRLDVLAAIATE